MKRMSKIGMRKGIAGLRIMQPRTAFASGFDK
jgi:hypothetical protein